MSNVLNNYFTSIAKKTNSNIKFSRKHYVDQLSYSNTNTFLLTPTDKNQISLIISSLASHKSSGPNSIPVKIFKLLKNDISQQLSDIFNMSFRTGQFPSVLKIVKVIPIHKKQSRVDYTNYRPISFLSNIERIIEKLMNKRLSNFLALVVVYLQTCRRHLRLLIYYLGPLLFLIYINDLHQAIQYCKVHHFAMIQIFCIQVSL